MRMNTRAVVIGSRDIDEADRLLTLLSSDYGVINAYAKGANRMKNKFAPTTELLCYASYTLFKNKERYSVDDADSLNLFFGLREDIDKLSLATYFAELTATIAPQCTGADVFLSLLLNTLHLLEKEKRSRLFLKPVFELRALTLAGYMPNLVACTDCACYEHEKMFFLLDGGLLCGDCLQQRSGQKMQAVALSKGVLTAMRHIVYSQPQRLFAFELPPAGLQLLGDVVEKYLIHQTETNYRTLDFYKSLSMPFL